MREDFQKVQHIQVNVDIRMLYSMMLHFVVPELACFEILHILVYVLHP